MVAKSEAFQVRMSDIRRRRRLRELCAEPGCKTKSGTAFRCRDHQAQYTARMQRYRVRKRQREALAKRAAVGVGRY